MSSFCRETQRPITGEWQQALWIDNHFGAHRYGVQFPDGRVFDPEQVTLETRDVPAERDRP